MIQLYFSNDHHVSWAGVRYEYPHGASLCLYEPCKLSLDCWVVAKVTILVHLIIGKERFDTIWSQVGRSICTLSTRHDDGISEDNAIFVDTTL